MPNVTIAVMIQDGSNQHHDESNFDFDDLLSKPDGSEVLASELVSMFNRLAPQVQTDARLKECISSNLDLVAKLETNLAQYKLVVRDQSAQIARQQGEIIRLEAKIKLMRATEYCRVHGVTHVDDQTLKNWVPGPVLPAPAQMNLDEMVAASEGMLSMDSSNQIYSGLREDAELTELVALMAANIHRHYNPEL